MALRAVRVGTGTRLYRIRGQVERRTKMKKSYLIAAAATVAAFMPTLTAPAIAQTSSEQRRWDDAQARYRAEFDRYLRERDLYTEARLHARYGSYQDDYYDRYRTDYDAAEHYRSGSQYAERQLGPQDQVYRGSDGRYYCKRSDGTTGLIVGGAGGAVLGNVIDGGDHRAAGTLIGGALGALLGRTIEQSSSEYRCR